MSPESVTVLLGLAGWVVGAMLFAIVFALLQRAGRIEDVSDWVPLFIFWPICLFFSPLYLFILWIRKLAGPAAPPRDTGSQ